MSDTLTEKVVKRMPFKDNAMDDMHCKPTPTGDVVCEVVLAESKGTVYVTIPKSAL